MDDPGKLALEVGCGLGRHELVTGLVHYAGNVSALWCLPFHGARGSDREDQRRARGYRLNMIGRPLDRFLMAAFPSQVCNVLSFIGEKSRSDGR